MDWYRWAWFALACVAVAAGVWGTRLDVQSCQGVFCVVVNRYSGNVRVLRPEPAESAPSVPAASSTRDNSLEGGRELVTEVDLIGRVRERVDSSVAQQRRGGPRAIDQDTVPIMPPLPPH
jgi:hypothetical protein